MAALALAGTILMGVTLGGCGGAEDAAAKPAKADSAAEIALPADPQARAATCYAARVARFSSEGDAPGLSVGQATEAAHFLLLGATINGATEPAIGDQLQLQGKPQVAAIRDGGTADRYAAACARAYPATVKGRFAALPADSPATRTQCYSLAFAVAQVLGNSPQVQGDRVARYVKLAETLDARLYADAQAAGGVDAQKMLGEVKRALGTTLEMGPIADVLDACAARYAA